MVIRMNCNEIRPKLSEFVDGRASARETWEIDRHIASCNSCANFHTELKMTVGVLQSCETFQVSEDFSALLQAKLIAASPKLPMSLWYENLTAILRGALRPSPTWGYGVCALAILVLLPMQFRTEQISSLAATRGDSLFVHASRTHAIAMTASDPFGDTAAASMAASNQNELDVKSGSDTPI